MTDYSILIKRLLSLKVASEGSVQREIKRFAKERGLDTIPKKSDILAQVKGETRQKLLPLLKKKPIRTKSGVAVVAVMTKPTPCPHGKCIYCPGGVEQDVPQSYTGFEPATMRGIQHKFDPYKQVTARISQLESIGHDTDKIELIIMGGTFLATDPNYQKTFIKGCYDGLNGHISRNLEQAILENETAKHRCVGLTIETRPDWAGIKEINRMLEFGTTRVELGVQNPNNKIYEKVQRGHTVEDVISATRLLKDSAFKVLYHLMPGLPGSNPKKDMEMALEIFKKEEYRPDMLKIYPTLVIENTQLYNMWKQGEYKPYDTKTAAKIIAKICENVPRWVRVMRVQRDIPTGKIAAGVLNSNLRQYVQEELERSHKRCNCIRCREIGHKVPPEEVDWDNIQLNRIDYIASKGQEMFLSFDEMTHDALVGFLRLRLPSGSQFRPEITDSTALVRELHVYGEVVPLNSRKLGALQHKQFGKQLLAKAEQIAKEEFNMEKILVISGVGVREYYKKRGYVKDGPYMSKMLTM